MVGYVTTTTGPWTQVLKDDPRVVLTLKTDDIDARMYCRRIIRLYSGTAVDLVQMLLGRPEPVPEC